MRLQEIIGMTQEYFLLALIAIIVFGLLFCIGYFVVYKKLLKGKASLSKEQLFLSCLFIGYVIMVIGFTFLNRGSNNLMRMDLSLFASYREAWFTFSARHWQFIYLNIFMFVPFGILFPLLHTRFRKASWTIGMAALFTLSIESFQLFTGYGVFEADDLFNNLLGASIGYGLVMGMNAIKRKRMKQFFVYLSPLFLVLLVFGSLFSYYNLKEFGNLSSVPFHRTNMEHAKITIDVQLDQQRRTAPIYKAPSYTKAAANEFVVAYFEQMNLNTSELEIISYSSEGVYWLRDERSYNIWFHYLDGGYSYTDFTIHDEGKELKDTDEETLKAHLKGFGIAVREEADFQKIDTGIYEWSVDKKATENQLIDGSITVNYYNDDTVKEINHRLITYDKVRDVEMKSEQEAYQEVLDGKFGHYVGDGQLETLHIEKVEVSYALDSKGYYQPVYAFYGIADGIEKTILIPGI